MSTPEAGGGKDSSDQDFKGVSGYSKRVVNSGFDVISAGTVCEAADEGKVPTEAKLNREFGKMHKRERD
jgi:hypothetical protein